MKPGSVDLFTRPLNIKDGLNKGASVRSHGDEKSFFEALGDSINEVNNLQLKANRESQELAAGSAENIHDVMISMEKASVSFRMMAQVRNKVLEAYQEVMRMQV